MANNNEKTSNERKYTDKNGKFKEGNPGRPKGSKNYLTLLEEALEREADKANKSYWEKLAEWCYTNPQLAVSILKKFVPDKSSTDITTDGEGIRFIIERANEKPKDKGNKDI